MESTTRYNSQDGDPLADPTQYRSLVGRLVYLTITRPNITFTINKLSQFLAHLRTCHLITAHKVLRYLKSAPNQGIFSPSYSNVNLQAFSDLD